MKTDDSKPNLVEKYAELARKSLVQTQYSCSGNSTPVEGSDFVSYRPAIDEDIPEIIHLLAECKLPHSHIASGKQHFVVAEIDSKIIGCGGLEAYNESGLFRSLTVKPLYRNMKIGQHLIDTIFVQAQELGITKLYLLTTTADKLFAKLGWETINRNDVPEEIGNTDEFSSICPSVAICMKHQV